MILRRELVLLITALSTILFIQFLVHLYITHYEFLPMTQGDMGGYAYIWYEKLISNHFIQLYSPSKSSSYPSDLNNPFLSIIPAIIMKILHTWNIYEGIYILYLEVITLGFVSMYLLVRIYVNNVYISLLTASLYVFSPLFLGIYFIPALKLSYALLPLGLLPIMALFKKADLSLDELALYTLIQAFTSLIISWSHPEVFILFIFICLFTLIMSLIFNKKRIKRLIYGLLFLFTTFIIGTSVSIGLHYIQNPIYHTLFMTYRMQELSPFALKMDLIEYLGLCDYDSFAYFAYIMSHLPEFTQLYVSYITYTIVFSIILWLPIVVYLIFIARNRPLNKNVIIFTIILAIITYASFKNWDSVRLAITEIPYSVPPFSMLKEFAIIFRTPARLNCVVAPLLLLSFGISIEFLAKGFVSSISKHNFKTNTARLSKGMKRTLVLALTITCIVMLNSLSMVLPGTFTYLHHVTRNSPYGFEWPWSSISYVDKVVSSYTRPFQYRMLDYTVYEPHYIYLGNKFFSIGMRDDLDLIELYRNPNFGHLLHDLGIKFIAISNWTSKWYFLGGDFKKILDNDFSVIASHDNISVYCSSCGKAIVWIKIPKIKSMSTLNIMVLLHNYTNNIKLTGNYKPLYTESSRPIVLPLHDLASVITKRSAFTIEAIVKLNSLGITRDQWIFVAKKNSWGNYGFGLFYGWGEDLYFNTGNWSYFVGAIVKRWDVFHKIIAVYNDGMLKLYIDNSLVAQKNVGRKLTLKELNAYIGGSPNGKYKLNGTILDAKIFPYAINPCNLRVKITKYAGDRIYISITNLGNRTLYDQWVKIVIPILGNNKIVYSATAKVDNKTIPLRFFLEEYKAPTTIPWVEIRKPMLVLGGVTALSTFLSLNNSFFVPVFLRQLEIPTALQLFRDSTPFLMVNVDPIDLYLLVTRRFIHDNATYVVSLYKYYVPIRSALLKGFGRHYWSKPFFGAIPSDPYGDLSISPFLVYVPENMHAYSMNIRGINIRVRSEIKYHLMLRLITEGRDPNINIRLCIENKTLNYNLRGSGYQFLMGWIDLGSFTPSSSVIRNIKLSLTKNRVGVYLDAIAIMPECVINKVLNLNRQVFSMLNLRYISVSTSLPKRIPYIALKKNINIQLYLGYGVLGSNIAKAYVMNRRCNIMNIIVYKPLPGYARVLLYVIKSSKAILNIMVYPAKTGINTHVMNRTLRLDTTMKPTWIAIGSINSSSGIYKVSITLRKGYAIIGAIALSNTVLVDSEIFHSYENKISNITLIAKRNVLKGVIYIEARLNKSLKLPSNIYIYVKEPYYAYKVKTGLKAYEVLPAYGIFTLIKIPAISLNSSRLMIRIEPYSELQIPYVIFSLFSFVCMILIPCLALIKKAKACEKLG